MRLYAHRGSPGSTSYENTVPAVAASLAAGADGVEVDLRLSSDGVLVASHDANLRRLAASPLLVATTPWDELRVACELRGVPLARAEWLLAAVAGRPVILELKHPMPGMVARTTAALVEMLSSLAAAGLPLDVTVSSFSPALVAAVRSSTAALGVRTALLGRVVDRPSALLRRTLDAGHDEMHPHVVTLLGEPSAVEHAHALGVTVVPWTVNRGSALRRLAALGVDGMITDVPATARLGLAARRAQAP
jgi:glycerophosphoryl diester phosphodiesterase